MARYATFYENTAIGNTLSDLNGKRVRILGEDHGAFEVEVLTGDRFEFTAYETELFEWSES